MNRNYNEKGDYMSIILQDKFLAVSVAVISVQQWELLLRE